MAKGGRKYVRDNRGRFASVGATARGGRLKTAGGNKRATVTAKISRPRVIKMGQGAKAAPKAAPKPVAQKPKLQRGQVVRGNFRPVNTMAKPQRSDGTFGKDKKTNVETAISLLQAKLPSGAKVQRKGQKRSPNIMSWSPSTKTMFINTSHGYWNDPRKHSRNWRQDGTFSSSNPKAMIAHEIGHVRHRTLSQNKYFFNVDSIAKQPDGKTYRAATRVSRYATTNPNEFVAEVRGGRATGRRYDHQVMRAYRAAAGLPKTSVRKPVRRR